MHLIIGSILSDPIHRTVFVGRTDLITSFLNAFNFFLIGLRDVATLFFFKVPLHILYTLLLALSLFSNEKKIKLLFFFIISILILQSIVGSYLINIFFIGIFNIFEGFNFTRIDRVLPLAFTLLFIFKLNNKNLKGLLYFVSIISILSIQFQTPLPQIVKYILQKNMQVDKFDETKNKILENNYISGFKIILKESTFPLEFFILMGHDYIKNPKIGKKIHLERIKFEKHFEKLKTIEVKKALYQKFAEIGIGRTAIIYAKK